MLDLPRGLALEHLFCVCQCNLHKFRNFRYQNTILFLYIFRLRYTQPDLVRPIRVPLIYPFLYLLATIFVVVVPMVASPVETGYGCLMILSSVPVYLIFIAWKSKPKNFQMAMGK